MRNNNTEIKPPFFPLETAPKRKTFMELSVHCSLPKLHIN